MAVAATNFAEGRQDLISTVLVPAIKHLNQLEDTRWIHALWFRKEREDIFDRLDHDERETILAGLVLVENVDYHVEELLIPLAKRDPGRIITFFGERLRYEEKRKNSGRYDAIPYKFNNLHKVLAEAPRIAAETVRSWFLAYPVVTLTH